LVPVLAKMISCSSGVLFLAPKGLIRLPNALCIQNAVLSLCGFGESPLCCSSVYWSIRDTKMLIHALELIQRFSALRTSPNSIAGQFILSHGEDQRDVEGDSRRCEFFERIEPRWCSRDLDHSVVMPRCPFFAKFDVSADSFCVRQIGRGILQQWIQFKTDPTRVASTIFPDRMKRGLCIAHKLVGYVPTNGLVILPLCYKRGDGIVKTTQCEPSPR
jgi:hypothetical protein